MTTEYATSDRAARRDCDGLVARNHRWPTSCRAPDRTTTAAADSVVKSEPLMLQYDHSSDIKVILVRAWIAVHVSWTPSPNPPDTALTVRLGRPDFCP